MWQNTDLIWQLASSVLVLEPSHLPHLYLGVGMTHKEDLNDDQNERYHKHQGHLNLHVHTWERHVTGEGAWSLPCLPAITPAHLTFSPGGSGMQQQEERQREAE